MVSVKLITKINTRINDDWKLRLKRERRLPQTKLEWNGPISLVHSFVLKWREGGRKERKSPWVQSRVPRSILGLHHGDFLAPASQTRRYRLPPLTVTSHLL